MDEKKELVSEILSEFFDTQDGGYKEVAQKIGLSDQTLYNIIAGRKNMAKLETVLLINEHYPTEFSPYLIRIFHVDFPAATIPEKTSSIPTPPDGIDWKKRFLELEAKYNNLEGKFSELFDKYNGLVDRVMAKMAFNTSGSHTTAFEHPYRTEQEVYGLIRYPEKEASAEVRTWTPIVHRNDSCFARPMKMYA